MTATTTEVFQITRVGEWMHASSGQVFSLTRGWFYFKRISFARPVGPFITKSGAETALAEG